MIIALAEQDLVFASAMMAVGNLPNHLEGLLVGLRSGVGIIDAAQAGHLAAQLFREPRTGHGSGRIGKIVHLDQLIAHSVRDAGPAIADIHGPDPARDTVKVFLARDVPDPHALAFDNDARINRFERLVLDQVMPDMVAVGFDNATEIIGFDIQGHGTCSKKS